MSKIGLFILCALVLGWSGVASAARHYAIVTRVAPKDFAVMEVSSDAPGTQILWTVFANAGPKFTAPLSTGFPDLFVSSAGSTIPNFSVAASGGPVVVAADSVDLAGNPIAAPTSAVLRQGRSGSTTNVMSLPSQDIAAGTAYSFPVGDLSSATALYIAAIDVDAQVTPTIGSTPGATVAVPAFTVTQLVLDKPNTRVALNTATPAQRLLVVLSVNVKAAQWNETLILPIH